MALFTESEAAHFFSLGIGAGIPDQSFRSWAATLSKGTIFTEGTSSFVKMSFLANNEIERLLVLAASHFRRAHDLLAPISSPWAFVTLYYGSYYGAAALMGMHGAWKLKKNMSLNVLQSTPGSQQVNVSKSLSTYSGSHQQFWEFYFSNALSLLPAAAPLERFALQPVSADTMWLIENRNELNYDTFTAVDMAAQFNASFKKEFFPGSLPGPLSTQFRFLEALMLLCNRAARNIGIDSTALASITAGIGRSNRVRDLVLKSKPVALGRKAKVKVVCG